ncbi:MAG: M20/M25/M40 family metallo-hydrolase [Deltaproteobacteria bacterium]|nr:MAG: M20/M25/M40 family metallo-hydrolase [Deltaproteobacteria bacterium]
MKRLIILWTLLISFTVQAGLMEDSLKYLSSDALEGRRAGSTANATATDYVADQLKNLGLEAFAGSYLQDFTIFTGMSKFGDNTLRISGDAFTKFEPVAFSSSGDLVSKDLIFVGFGISIPKKDPKITYDDYQGLDVEGKIVVLMTGDPGVGNAQSPFRDPDYINYRTLIYKLKNAEQKGAVGVIILNDPLSLIDPNTEADPTFNSRDGGGDRFALLAGKAKNKWFNDLSKTSLLDLQKKIASSSKPASFAIGKTADLSVHMKRNTGRVSNVVGFLKGTDPDLSREVIVLGAHFDHLGMGGQSSMDPSNDPKIHNGADDNASGTAMLLHLAEKLSKKKMKRSVLFAFFNAEEIGLLGSKHLVSMWSRYEADYGKMYGMLNFDMVGRFQTEVALMGLATAHEWNDVLSTVTNRSIPIRTKKDAVGSSDHASFINADVPSLFYTTGAHSDYHRSTDDFEKIDLKSMGKIADHAEELVGKIAGEAVALTFDPDSRNGSGSGRNRGYGAHLGCVPEFGQSDDIVGVLCVRTTPGSPAEAAGVLGGDILVQIGDIEIKTIYDLAFALKFYRAGDKIELAWKRGRTIIKKEITLARSSRGDDKNNHHSCHHVEIY